MPHTDDYRLQYILYWACRSTAQSSDSTSALELVKCNQLREAYILDIDGWDTTTWTWHIKLIITDGYERCRQRKLPLMPSHEQKLNHSDDSDKDLHRDTSYGNDGRWSMGSKVNIWGQDHFWIYTYFSPHLFFSSLDLGLVQMASAWVFTTFRVSQVEVDFPHAPDPPKGCRVWYRLVAGLMSWYEYVSGMIALCSSFPFLSLYRCLQPRRSASEVEDNATAASVQDSWGWHVTCSGLGNRCFI